MLADLVFIREGTRKAHPTILTLSVGQLGRLVMRVVALTASALRSVRLDMIQSRELLAGIRPRATLSRNNWPIQGGNIMGICPECGFERLLSQAVCYSCLAESMVVDRFTNEEVDDGIVL